MPKFERSPRRSGLMGLYRAMVQKVEDDGRLWVHAPRLAGGDSVGPLPTVVFPRPVAAGDRVIVQSVEGMAGNLMVTAVLAAH